MNTPKNEEKNTCPNSSKKKHQEFVEAVYREKAISDACPCCNAPKRKGDLESADYECGTKARTNVNITSTYYHQSLECAYIVELLKQKKEEVARLVSEVEELTEFKSKASLPLQGEENLENKYR